MLYQTLIRAAVMVTCFGAAAAQVFPPVVPDTSSRVEPIELPDLMPVDTSQRTFPWRHLIELNLGLTQSFATDNWAGGQSNSILWVSDLRGKLDKQITRSWVFDNDLRLAYGQSHSYDTNTEKWSPPLKSTDRIRFDSILRRFGHIVDPYVAAALETQFVDKRYHRELYLNPAELTESVGIAHYLFNDPMLRTVRSRAGVGARQRLIQSFDTLQPNRARFHAVVDAGAEWVTDAELGSVFTRVSYITKLTLFQAVYNSRARSGDDRWRTLDVSWDSLFRVNITRMLIVGVSWQLLYDEEITPGVRFRENMTLSVSLRHGR